MSLRVRCICIFGLWILTALARAELSPEPIPSVKTLPSDYPDTWIFAHDANFQSLVTGKVIVLDVAAETNEYKGMIDAAQMASFIESKHQPLLYVAESFYDRSTRGKRTDVVTIYDKSTLAIVGEIPIANNHRAQIVLNKNAMQLIDDDKFLLVYGFTPAQSVIVIDTEQRKVVNEISTAGCAMAYPAGKRGFMSLCSDGGALAIQVDDSGKEIERHTVASFFSVDDDPLFDKAVYMDQTAYFVSYLGRVQGIDLSGSVPKLLDTWSLVSDEEAEQNWRPGGWQITAADNDNNLYVIMHENGYNGSHKFGGEQVWVFDTKTQKKISTVSLNKNAFSIEMTNSKQPYLTVTNVEMGMDIYSASGEFLKYINVGDAAMPIMLHAVR